jgi:hypothetical protein
MSIIRFTPSGGANQALEPKLLPDSTGVQATNQKPGRGDLRPWGAPLNKAVVPAGRKTIYRMGRDVVSDTNYWLSWPTVVHVVVGGNAADTSERTYYTGSGAPKWTDNTKALPVGSDSNSGARTLGVPAPASACTLSASGGVSTLSEVRYYTYTYVSDIGEESAPNPSPTMVTCKPDDTVTINSLVDAPDGSYGINKIRIYRTQSGSSGDATFFFLREIASTATTTTDDNRVLGEVMATTTWLPPDASMTWLTGLWNGIMAGIVGRGVRFCEANTYYAWPIGYEVLPPNVKPVALATFGQNLVMLTDGNPSIITGGSPESMDEQPVEFYQSCIAPLSAVGMGHGVAWASPDGLAYLGAGGPRLLTAGIMTRDDWQAINPSSIQGCMYEGRYFGFCVYGGGNKGFIFDPANPQGMYFLDFGADAVHVDALQDALFVLNGTNVQKFDFGAAKTVTFKSKVFHQTKPVHGFACAEVIGEALGPLLTCPNLVSGKIYIIVTVGTSDFESFGAATNTVNTVFTASANGSGATTGTVREVLTTFKLYADGVLKHTQSVTSANPFRLPGGYHGQDFQVEVSTTGSIQGVALAHSMQELSQT